MTGALAAAQARVQGLIEAGRSRTALGVLAGSVLVAVAYVAAAQVGYAFALVRGNASPIWPPAGIAVAAVLLGGVALWPGIFVGAFAANLAHGISPAGAAFVGAGNAAEALVAAALLGRTGLRPQLDRLGDVPRLILGSALPALVGASLGLLGLSAAGTLRATDVPLAWSAWAAGDALSIFVIGGFLLSWATPPADDVLRARPLETLLAIASVAGASIVLFFDVFNLRAVGESVAFPVIPLMVWVAFRVGPRGTSLASLMFSAIAILATEQGRGPFVGAALADSLFYVTLFIGLTATSSAAVAAVVAERDAKATALRATAYHAADALARLQALEAIGRRLAAVGPTPEALDAVLSLLCDSITGAMPSVYVGDDLRVRLAAQRGYANPAPEIGSAQGIVGRVMRTHAPVHLPDVSLDPAFVRDHPSVRSEISVPLLAGGEFLGVLDVESPMPMDERDLASLTVVADRLAAALALAAERDVLAARATLFERLVAYSERIGAVLGEAELYPLCVAALDGVVRADLVGLVVRDPASGEYVVRAEKGSTGSVGRAIRPGEGPAGRAIQDRALIRVAPYARDAFPATVREWNAADVYGQAVGVPLVREDTVIGSLTVARIDPGAPFSDLELEALSVLADEIALAVANALLHGQVAELAIHDALTGLHNRRYFDAALPQLLSVRSRIPAEHRSPLSAILFDLDHFGALNLRHGHQVGDEVLRAFGAILRGRLRGADLVARYGGEEFVAILSGATREDARRVADGIRLQLAATRIAGIDGRNLGVTVSAGCAGAEDSDSTGETLVRAADLGLLMAKRSGRNTVVAA